MHLSQIKTLLCGLSLTALLAPLCMAPRLHALSAEAASPHALQSSDQASDTVTAPKGVPFSQEKLGSLLPATVYFQEKTAPLQLRNAAGTTFGSQAIVWASLVDTSGYSTSVQERYQFYLVTESGLLFGSVHLPAGAYGGGYLGDRFVLMDLGGHTVGEGGTQMDANLRRPRPLQMVADGPSSVKLYLGRRWVSLQANPKKP